MYIKTERFKLDLDKVADILRKRGYTEEWVIITPYQEESRMYNLIENKYASLRVENDQTVVDYSKWVGGIN